MRINLVKAMQPEIEALLKNLLRLSDWINDHQKDIEGFFKEAGTDIEDCVDAVGGWKNALDILLTYTAVTWSAKMVMSIGRVAAAFTELFKFSGKIIAVGLVIELWNKVRDLQKAARDANMSVGDYLSQQMQQTQANGKSVLTFDQVEGWFKRAGDFLWGSAPATFDGAMTPEQQASSDTLNKTQYSTTFSEPEQHAQAARRANSKLGWLSPMFSKLESQYGLPAGLLDRVAMTESSGNQFAVSSRGAEGLFQFMPKTAAAFGLHGNDVFDPAKSSAAAARYLHQLLTQFGGNVGMALAAYNWGPGNLMKKGIANAPMETQRYVQKITGGVPLGNAASAYRYANNASGQTIISSEANFGDINVNSTGLHGDGKQIGRDITSEISRRTQRLIVPYNRGPA